MSNAPVFKRILVSTDGSFPSLIAQELTAFLAKKLQSQVTVLHAVNHEFLRPELETFISESARHVGRADIPPEMPSQSHVRQEHAQSPTRRPPVPQKTVDEMTSWFHQKGEKAISDAVALFNEEGIPVEPKLIEHAEPAETILKEAERGNYDLIVMGHSGEEEQDPHLGSVAEKVSRHAETPVLVTREKRSISKMLVPVDGSKNSEKALNYAVAVAEKTDAEITLLYVQESGLFKLRPKATKEFGARVLSGAADQITGTAVEERLESGDPAKIITQIAEEEDYDLVVMGSRGLGAIGRFLLGSVSDHVLHYANRSVLVVR